MSQDNLHDDEKQFEDVIAKLKSLEKVSAPPGFEANLMRRINQEKFAAEEKQSFWKKFFTFRYLVPSTVGVTAVAVIIILLVNQTNLVEKRTTSDIENFGNPPVISSTQDESSQKEGEVKKESVPQNTNSMPVAKENTTPSPESKDTKLKLDEGKALRSGASPQLQKSEETEIQISDQTSEEAVPDTLQKMKDKKSVLKKDTTKTSGKDKK